MTYLDKDHNEIGDTIGEVRGWIEATHYTGDLYFEATGFHPVRCSWQFARQWYQEIDEQYREKPAIFDFIRQHQGDTE